jgi:hypothetical protein
MSAAIHAIPVSLALFQFSADMDIPPDLPPEALDELGVAPEGALSSEAPFNITILEEVPPEAEVAEAPKLKKSAEPKPVEKLPEPEPEVVAEAPAAEQQPEAVTEVADVIAPPAEVPAPDPVVAAVEPTPPAPQAGGTEAAVADECPPDPPGITELSSSSWSIDRSLVDYYANHIKELMKLAWVGVHKDEAGKPDGFRIVLKKCSILRNGGLQSHDVVLDVGGVRVHSLLTAVKAYFKLRKQPVIPLTVKRNDQTITLSYQLK